MAFAVTQTLVTGDFAGTVTDRRGKTPQTRGVVYNNQPAQAVMHATKLTGDATGTLDLPSGSDVGGIDQIRAVEVRDNAGAAPTDANGAWLDVTFAVSDSDTVTLSSLGDWTQALIFVFGRTAA